MLHFHNGWKNLETNKIMGKKPKYPIGGYADGNYMCNCVTCKKQFIGDKRAVQCEPCAIEMVNTKIISNQGGGIKIDKQEQIQENNYDRNSISYSVIREEETIEQSNEKEELVISEEAKQRAKNYMRLKDGYVEPKETIEEAFYRIRKSINYEEFDFTSFEFGVNWERGNADTNALDFEIKALKSIILDMDATIKSLFNDDEVFNLCTHLAVEIIRQNRNKKHPIEIKQWFERNKDKFKKK